MIPFGFDTLPFDTGGFDAQALEMLSAQRIRVLPLMVERSRQILITAARDREAMPIQAEHERREHQLAIARTIQPSPLATARTIEPSPLATARGKQQPGIAVARTKQE